jgi:hypothetical protein
MGDRIFQLENELKEVKKTKHQDASAFYTDGLRSSQNTGGTTSALTNKSNIDFNTT